MGSECVSTVCSGLLALLEKRLALICGFLALILMTLSTPAHSATLLVVASDDSPAYREFLAQQWPTDNDLLALDVVKAHETRLIGLIIWTKSAASRRKPSSQRATRDALMRTGSPALTDLCQQVDVVVAVADAAARAAEKSCSIPLLMVLAPNSQLKLHLNPTQGPARTAIYQEADPASNLQLIRELLPKAITVGVIVSPQQQTRLSHLRTEANRLRFQLEEIDATNDEEAVRALRKRTHTLDALLLLPDLQLINAWSLKPILLMTIRQMVPTFGGPTGDYVRAGVLAAVVADLNRLPTQIVSIAQRLAHGEIPVPAYPEETRVIVNSNVAGALSIKIPSTWNAHAE
jgi:ABC-type uncharacterized transport system substrate-binding protein